MKSLLTIAMLPIALLCLAATNQQQFILTTSDNELLGKGTIEITDNQNAQASINLDGVVFLGSGEMHHNVHAYASDKRKLGMRSDRAFMAALGKAHSKEASITLNNDTGLQLMCHFKPKYDTISGQCVNNATQEMLLIKSATEVM